MVMERQNSLLAMANLNMKLSFKKKPKVEVEKEALFLSPVDSKDGIVAMDGTKTPKLEIEEETCSDQPTTSNMPINPLGINSRQISPSCYFIALDQCPTVKELFQYAQGLSESGVVMDEPTFFDSEKPGAYINFFINVGEVCMADLHRDILAPWTLTVDGKTLCKIRTENQTYVNLDGKTSTSVRYSLYSKHPRQAPITKKVAIFPIGNANVKPHSGFIVYKVEQPFNLCEYTSVKGLARKRRNYDQNDHETAQFIDSFLKTEAAEKQEEQKKLGRCMGKLSKLEDQLSQLRKQAYMNVLNGNEAYLDFLVERSATLLIAENPQNL
ncbi:unnamed protein product, partial [Mesorhabditis belari]|uniref:Uncharacterized protein n=1 Tax=Mesorhabditis belari TaxID=2138241 RepID=A0AAF3EHH7_9BILA